MASDYLEVIIKAPKPTTIKQMLSFLGAAGYSRPWVSDYAQKSQPLRHMIKAAVQGNVTKLTWMEEAEGTFEQLKADLSSVPALSNPDYSKPFHQFVAEQGFAIGVLTHQQGSYKQPIAYFSTQFNTTTLLRVTLLASMFPNVETQQIQMHHQLLQCLNSSEVG